VVFRIHHRTAYRYAAPVSLSRQLLHLAPREVVRQHCLEHELHIEPAPSRRVDDSDVFGNPLTRLEFDRPHVELTITAQTRVRVTPRAEPVDAERSPAWEDVVEQLAYRAGAAPTDTVLQATRFRFESPYVRVKSVLADYARASFAPRRPLLAAATALMNTINSEFTYDPKATQIATPLLEVFASRRGVCQDFAHLMLACLRSLGLSARYVSGYLRTSHAAGRARLVGADASHAWVSLYCPLTGWVDFDPTNRVIADSAHVTVAWGRDFGDVSPLRGVILGGGAHELDVAVSVVPETP